MQEFLIWLVIPMNETKSSTRGEGSANDVNDVHQIIHEVNKLKDELRRV